MNRDWPDTPIRSRRRLTVMVGKNEQTNLFIAFQSIAELGDRAFPALMSALLTAHFAHSGRRLDRPWRVNDGIEGAAAANPELWEVGRRCRMAARIESRCKRRFSMQGTDKIDPVTAPFCRARTSFCFTTPESSTSASEI